MTVFSVHMIGRLLWYNTVSKQENTPNLTIEKIDIYFGL